MKNFDCIMPLDHNTINFVKIKIDYKYITSINIISARNHASNKSLTNDPVQFSSLLKNSYMKNNFSLNDLKQTSLIIPGSFCLCFLFVRYFLFLR